MKRYGFEYAGPNGFDDCTRSNATCVLPIGPINSPWYLMGTGRPVSISMLHQNFGGAGEVEDLLSYRTGNDLGRNVLV